MDTSDSIFVHSPKTHYHAKTSVAFMESRQSSGSSPSKSDSSTKSDMEVNKRVTGIDFSGSEGSDVSDMIIDKTSRFQKLSGHRRKSGESDYRPVSDSNNEDVSDNSKSVLESESEESGSEGSSMVPKRSKLHSGKRHGGAISEDDSEESRLTPRSISNPAVLHDLKRTPIVRKSPLGVSQPRTNLRDVAVMRGYRYSMHPSRTAAMNVSYKRYLAVDENEESDESSEDSTNRKKGRGNRRRDSDSDFEVPGMEESSEDVASMEEGSEEEYYPPKRKGRVGRRRKDWEEASGSDSDYLPGGGRKKRGGRGGRKIIKRSAGYEHTFVSDGEVSGSSSGSEFEPGGYQRRRGKKAKQRRGNNNGSNRVTSSPSDFTRTTGRSRGVVNYKDFYGGSEGEGEDEAGEGAEGETPVPAVEDNRETIERILKKRVGLVGDIGDRTTCYARFMAASKSGNSDGGDAPAGGDVSTADVSTADVSTADVPVPKLSFSYGDVLPDQPTETQYLVKWLKWSHLHDTWETEASLTAKDIKGMKKFYNFLKKEEDQEAWEREANPEDIEYLKCQEELADELVNQFIQVERVIAAQDSTDGGQEYLCKWRGLPYSECTWEDGALVSSWFQEEIDAFIERNSSDCIPNKNAKVLRHRPKFVYVKEQRRSLGGGSKLQLRDYQLEGVNWLVKSWCKSNSVILADEMGLGKTIQTIAFLHDLFHQHQLYGPYIIVVPLSTMPGWQRECELWSPQMNCIIYLGDVNSRSKIREHEWCHPNRKLKFNILVTTYEILLKDKDFLGSVAWASLIVDEAHRLKNDDSLLYRTLMEFRTNHRLLITGTPLQNSIKELWSLLHFIMEKEFATWEDFEYEHHAYGAGDASSLASIHQQLQPYLLRRIKKDVEKSLPAKVEQILRVEMSSVQKQYYKWILTKNYKALSKGVKGSITGFINLMMELKKCCNHVWIVRSPDDKEVHEKDKLQTLIRGSGKLYLLDKLLVRLNQRGHRVLIFSQMVRMLDLLADYMRLRRFHFQRLDGSIRGDQRKDAIDHFNAEGSQDFCFLLSTRAGGLGVNLATADTVVIFDSDWNPQNDLQAQARAHRIGQKKQVNIYRLVTKNSVEEDIIERAKKKMVLDHLVIQRMDTTGRTILSASTEPSKSVPFDKEELNAILKFGAEDLFKSDDGEGGVGGAGDKELQEMDIDDILSRAETQATSEDSTHNDLLSQFKVASFVMEEDEPPPPVPTTPTDGSFLLSPMEKEKEGLRVRRKGVERSWEELIPDEARKKVEEEEKTKEQLSLYLPPRRRKVRNYCEDGSVKQETVSGRSKGRGTKGGVNNSKDHTPTSVSSSATSGFGTVISKNIRGFTDSEIRRFVKSFKKYVSPNSRLEAIAADAELQEKSLSELQRLMTVLKEGCVQAEEEHRAKIEMDEQYDPKKDKGFSLRLCGVTINSSALLRREEELEALAVVIPANPAVRRKYRLLSRPKAVHWEGVRWSAVDDAKLLVGVYEHGLGNWESIRDDPNLSLTSKILPADSSTKPQGSHLQTRVDYLLRLIQTEAIEKMKMKKKASKGSRSTNSSRPAPPRTAAGGGRKRGPKSSNLTVNISRKMLDDGEDSTGSAASIRTSSRNRKRPVPATATDSPAKRRPAAAGRKGLQVSAARESPRSRARKEKAVIPGERSSPRKRKGRDTKEEAPEEAEVEEEAVTEKDKVASEFEEGVELDDDTFQKCKSLLKPVKKFMVDLHPKEEDAERDPSTAGQFKEVIVEIGDHISSCLSSDNTLEDSSLWKINLWVFVSKFTKASPQKLHKIYKKAKKSVEFTASKPSVVVSQVKKEQPQAPILSQTSIQHHAAADRDKQQQQQHVDRDKQQHADRDKQQHQHADRDKEQHVDRDKQQHADRDKQQHQHADRDKEQQQHVDRDKQQHADRDKQQQQHADRDKQQHQHVDRDKEQQQHVDRDKQQQHQHADRDKPQETNSTHVQHSDGLKSRDQQNNSESELPASRSMDDLSRNSRDTQHGRDHRHSDDSPTRSHHHHGHRYHSDNHHRERRHSGGDYHSHHHHHGDEHKRERHHSGGDSHNTSHRHSDRYDGHSDRHDDYHGRSHHHKDRQRHSSGSSYHSDGASISKRPRYHSPPPSSHSSQHHHSHSSSSSSSLQKASNSQASH